MNIITLRDGDAAGILYNEMYFEIDGKEQKNDISEIAKISILTTDQGPFVDDVALVITFDDSVFIIPSEHNSYEKFLFDEIAKKLVIDFQKVIDASSCTDNAEFIIYNRC